MHKSKSLGFQSALIVNKITFISTFVLSLLAWWMGADAMAMLLLTLSAVGVISYMWGLFSLSKVNVEVKATSAVLSVGQTADIEYKIENNKTLPLVWVELCQSKPVNECMEPDSSMIERKFSNEEAEFLGVQSAYMRKFAFLMGHNEITWTCTWMGKKRGVYRPDNILLKSGDGFGLTQSSAEIKGLKGKAFVVWPKIVPVNASYFLKNIWSGSIGKSGWVEDPSVLRGEREYMYGDSWKRIDWRTAARTDELYTKQYEMIRPQSILFIVETTDIEDIEDALSVTASAMFELNRQGIAVGIALPATDFKDSVILRPDDPSVTMESCLFEIADHDVASAKEDSFNIQNLLAAAEGAGQVWIVGEDVSTLKLLKAPAALMYSSPGYLCAKGEGANLSFDHIREKEETK